MNIYMDRKREQRTRIFRQVVNYFITVLVALVLAFCFVYFLFQTTTVVGDSMAPTLEDGNRVVLAKNAYLFQKPQRYDVIKFKITKSKTDHEYIKRIVGLLEEKIQILDGSIYVDGEQLNDVPFDDLIVSAGIADEEFILGKDEYFVIGDNCNNSEDSRFTNVGAVTKDSIEGKVIARMKGIRLRKVK